MFDAEGFEPVPAGLHEMEPGPVLAGFLATIDVGKVSGHDRIVVLQAHQRMASHYTARVYEDVASVCDVMTEAGDDEEVAVEWAAAEVRAALRLTRRAADAEVDLALQLHRRLPRLWEALVGGDLDLRRVKTISYGTEHLPVETARSVMDRIVDSAPHLTTGQLAARIRRLCIEADPADAKRRHQEAAATRRVVSEPTTSGTANLLGFDLPPHRVAAATERIDRLARSLKRDGETRSIDQIRADVYLDLLQGVHIGTGGGTVDIHVDLDTLTRLTNHPGDLAGYGPVIADIARQVAERQTNTQWRYTVSHPDTGLPAAVGITRRRPTISQRRTVEAGHPTCIFPGCRIPANRCDLDHRIPHSRNGPTTERNLAPLCRHDHRIRHQAGWQHQPLPNGDYRWTTRLAHTYTTSGQPP